MFENFKNGSEFQTFVGQSTEAVTGMFNLYRASQLQFPGEAILDDAKEYSESFLTRKRAADQLLDKWIITKDLPGEVYIPYQLLVSSAAFPPIRCKPRRYQIIIDN